MNQFVDALGKACPTPVILAKKEIDSGNKAFVVAVDNSISVENLKKLAESQGYQATVEANGENFRVSFAGDGSNHAVIEEKTLSNWALFVGKESIGGGSDELGTSLMKMYFYTLSESANPPRYILFMNGGVKIPTQDEQVIEHLQDLQKKGSEVLVCGACLKFYGIDDQLQTGVISNMYDITEKMDKADKVITL